MNFFKPTSCVLPIPLIIIGVGSFSFGVIYFMIFLFEESIKTIEVYFIVI